MASHVEHTGATDVLSVFFSETPSPHLRIVQPSLAQRSAMLAGAEEHRRRTLVSRLAGGFDFNATAACSFFRRLKHLCSREGSITKPAQPPNANTILSKLSKPGSRRNARLRRLRQAFAPMFASTVVAATLQHAYGQGGPLPSSAEGSFDGTYNSREFNFGFRLDTRSLTATATISNSPLYKPGQIMLRYHMVGPRDFSGELVFTDGKFHPITGRLLEDGAISLRSVERGPAGQVQSAIMMPVPGSVPRRNPEQTQTSSLPTNVPMRPNGQYGKDILRYICSDSEERITIVVRLNDRSVQLNARSASGNEVIDSSSFAEGHRNIFLLAVFSEFVAISPQTIRFGEVDGLKGTPVRTYVINRRASTLRLETFGVDTGREVPCRLE
jgi:hypothetical protein